MTERDRGALARLFRYFAEHECRDDPLYAALCALVAARPLLLQVMVDHAPATQRVPNLLLAALHERVLAGVVHPLRDYFPTVGGTRRPDAALGGVLDDFVAAQQDELVAMLATRHTQTNEIGRCAILWPVLCTLAARAGGAPLALLDFGCSAGLNLAVDRFRYRYDDGGEFALGATAAPAVPQVACRVVGAGGAVLRAIEQPAPPRLMARLGVDPQPVDITDAAQVRWLRACVWPYDGERAARLAAAVAIASDERHPVRRCDDCFAAIEPWLNGLGAGVLPVVFNSWVLHYLEPAARTTLTAALRDLVQRRGIVWLSAEGAHLAPVPSRCERARPLRSAHPGARQRGGYPFDPVGDAQISDEQIAKGSQWWLTQRGTAGPEATLLARSHPHGRWLQWL